jgi:hypothetical protein
MERIHKTALRKSPPPEPERPRAPCKMWYSAIPPEPPGPFVDGKVSWSIWRHFYRCDCTPTDVVGHFASRDQAEAAFVRHARDRNRP